MLSSSSGLEHEEFDKEKRKRRKKRKKEENDENIHVRENGSAIQQSEKPNVILRSKSGGKWP
jgi:hypothetical protein